MGKIQKDRKSFRFQPYPTNTAKDNRVKFVNSKFNSAMRGAYSEKGATTYEGFHSKVVEQSQPKATQNYDNRFLTHLATALKSWFHRVHKGSEIEIQIALYEGAGVPKYIVSSNKDETAQTIYRELIKTTAKSFLRQVASEGAAGGRGSSAQEAFRVERQSVKMGKALDGKREGASRLVGNLTASENETELEREGRDLAVSMDVYGGSISEKLYAFLSNDDQCIAFVTGESGVHAEQKIMLALCLTAKDHRDILTNKIVFAGTFRPCRGCYESLSVVKNFVFPNLQFGERPGHFWQTTTSAHGQILEACKPFMPSGAGRHFDEGGTMTGLAETTYRPLLRRRGGKPPVESRHFDSDSESDEE